MKPIDSSASANAPESSGPRLRHAPAVLALSMFVMGACGIVYEYTLGVLGNHLIGSSHEQVFVIIGLMMFAMGLGAAINQRIVDRLVDRFLQVELLLGLIGGISALAIFAAFTWTASYQVVLYGFAVTIGALIGLEIPILIRINERYASSLRRNLSSILTMDYVGALAGALLFAFVLLRTLSLTEIAVVLGLVNTAIAAAGIWYFRTLVAHPRVLAIATLGVAVTLGSCLVFAESWTARLEQRCYADPIIESTTSPYQHLVLTKRDERLNLHINGKLQFSSVDEAIYHELLVHVPAALAPRRARVLILGGGDGLALRDVLRYRDVRDVCLVDLDPAVVELASTQPDLVELNRASFHDARVRQLPARGVTPGEPRTIRVSSKLSAQLLDERDYETAEVAVLQVDADVFVRAAATTEEPFDVVIVDFPDPQSVEVSKLYSLDFYRSLRTLVRPETLIAIQSTSPVHARDVFLTIGLTLREAGFHALPFHDNVPSFGEWGWHLAWRDDGPAPESVRSRMDALATLDVDTTYLTPELLRAAFLFGRRALETTTPLRANTKMRPTLHHLYAASQRSS